MTTGLRYAAPLPYPLDRAAVNEWCVEQFGESASIINSRWYMFEFTVQFKSEKDRNWFLLRWG